ncbi:MAG: sigma-54-dependent Fis family transcriptional regulator [Planctomycetes bacterium]|nr:sigma-54-dependent Fis family transcriptional regulator [Planctomycetota bacterium]
MGIFEKDESGLAETISRLDYCNPFLPERLELERSALGPDFLGFEQFLNIRPESPQQLEENVRRLVGRVGTVVESARQRLAQGAPASERERVLYEDLALFYLYHRFHMQFRAWISHALAGGARRRLGFFGEFEEAARHLFLVPGVALPHDDPPEHLFAFFFQLNRAFVNIYHHIVGGSMAAARLRGAIWQSIFTHDLRRYRRTLYERMGDIATLVTGPSGTGKELVARAVALSRYIPFDVKPRAFSEDFANSFHPLNPSALSPTLIESELFGHRRGAFTGALEDRKGWLEVCKPRGTVFLDEIGDLDPAIQVKLLRVLQTRTFQRLGETETRTFQGKIIAATNRDLSAALRQGAFREDFFYRLCSDMIETPSLEEQLGGNRDELELLVRFIARRMAGDEADVLTAEVVSWIEKELGLAYDWPGNFRELEQCVRNVLIRKEYRPTPRGEREGENAFLRAFGRGVLTAEQVLDGYCRLVRDRSGTLSEAARRLGLDRRTVKARAERSCRVEPAG